MKLYIVGSVASGKTSLAKEISRLTGVVYFSLDEVAHKTDKSQSDGNRRRSPEERDRIFTEILARQDYIIEDTGRVVFEEGMVRADRIILLETKPAVRRFRIIRRYIRQKLHLEECSYTPNLNMLRHMFRWSRNYENGKDGVRERVLSYGQKVTVLKNKKQIREFIKQL